MSDTNDWLDNLFDGYLTINKIKQSHNENVCPPVLNKAIKNHIREAIGEDEPEKTSYDEEYLNDNISARNQLRADIKKRLGL